VGRASIFEEEPDIDVSGFAPKSAPDPKSPHPEQIREVSEKAKFRSREPKTIPKKQVAAKREQRRYRTGRNVQFNLKASQETVDGFYAIADRQGWVLGEMLEHALAALERELSPDGDSDVGQTLE
jgi:hypothetical protein